MVPFGILVDSDCADDLSSSLPEGGVDESAVTGGCRRTMPSTTGLATTSYITPTSSLGLSSGTPVVRSTIGNLQLFTRRSQVREVDSSSLLCSPGPTWSNLT